MSLLGPLWGLDQQEAFFKHSCNAVARVKMKGLQNRTLERCKTGEDAIDAAQSINLIKLFMWRQRERLEVICSSFKLQCNL